MRIFLPKYFCNFLKWSIEFSDQHLYKQKAVFIPALCMLRGTEEMPHPSKTRCERCITFNYLNLFCQHNSLPLPPLRWHGVLSTAAPSFATCSGKLPLRRTATMACRSHAASRTTTSAPSTLASSPSSRSAPGAEPSWFCRSIMWVCADFPGKYKSWNTMNLITVLMQSSINAGGLFENKF